MVLFGAEIYEILNYAVGWYKSRDYVATSGFVL